VEGVDELLGRNVDFVTNTTMDADEVVDYTVESVVPGRVKAWKSDAIQDRVSGTECLGIAKRYYVTIVGIR
jgi:hypothetical protein